ncbi:dihydrodipicolinate synthase family protein [Escherichia coli]
MGARIGWCDDRQFLLFPLDDEAIFDFYSTIASQTPAHIFIYNLQENLRISVSPEICLRLADKYPNIIGMKDTVPDAFHTAQVINTVKKNIPHFEVYAGYDNNFAHNILSGGDGCIGGLSNIVPEFFASWMQAFTNDDLLCSRAASADSRSTNGRLQREFSFLFPLSKKPFS